MKFAAISSAAVATLASLATAIPTESNVSKRTQPGAISLLVHSSGCGLIGCRYDFSLIAQDNYVPGINGFNVECVTGTFIDGQTGGCNYSPANQFVSYEFSWKYPEAQKITIHHEINGTVVATAMGDWNAGGLEVPIPVVS
ncbi:hypothetical protein F5Y19DRAFT_419300 [Xylariaceae sp. FL1651]|nr:hypothetical protein F5Y19DRAFT_419300 [Xylariaceae sp. FL1651]